MDGTQHVRQTSEPGENPPSLESPSLPSLSATPASQLIAKCWAGRTEYSKVGTVPLPSLASHGDLTIYAQVKVQYIGTATALTCTPVRPGRELRHAFLGF